MDVSKFSLSDYASKLSDSDKLKYCEKLASINTLHCHFKINKQYWTETEKDLKCLEKTLHVGIWFCNSFIKRVSGMASLWSLLKVKILIKSVQLGI